MRPGDSPAIPSPLTKSNSSLEGQSCRQGDGQSLPNLSYMRYMGTLLAKICINRAAMSIHFPIPLSCSSGLADARRQINRHH